MSTIDRLYRGLPYWYRSSGQHVSALLGAWGTGIDEILSELDIASGEVSLTGASGIWLTWWGSLFGLTMFSGESGTGFLGRILQQIDPRISPANISNYLKWFSSVPVIVQENSGGDAINRTFNNYRLLPSAIELSYVRDSIAYTEAGVKVGTNVPVYANTSFGSNAGFWLWGPTVNLLTPNESSLSSGNTNGFTSISGATLSASTADVWTGTYALSVETTSSGQGVSVEVSGIASDSWYTASSWMTAPSGALLDMAIIDSSSTVIAQVSGVQVGDNWSRNSLSGYTTSTASGITWEVTVSSGSLWYMDGLQVEESPYPTAWQNADNAIRSGSVLSYSGDVLPNQGAFQVWVEPGWLAVGNGAVNSGAIEESFPIVSSINGIDISATTSGYVISNNGVVELSEVYQWDNRNFIDYSWYDGEVQLGINGEVVYSGSGPNIAGSAVTFGADSTNYYAGSYGPFRLLNMSTPSGMVTSDYALLERLLGSDTGSAAEDFFYPTGRTIETFLGTSLSGNGGVDRFGSAWYGRIDIAFDLTGSIANSAYCNISYADTSVYCGSNGLLSTAVTGVQDIIDSVRLAGVKLVPNYV